jgi:UDP-3-O-[3-hydroxymyristoyl] N-acetylglucosamine deacetylase
MIAEISRLSSDVKFCQKTFRNSIYAVGIGVHSGAKTKISFHPAPIDTGIVFRRVDITDRDNLIPADYAHVVDTRLCSCFGNEAGVTVSTAEHLMAALSSFGVSNAYIDVDGPEVPIMDGSAKDFDFLFDCIGLVEQEAPLKALRIKKEVVFEDGKGAVVSLSPAEEGLSLEFMIDFPAKAIGHQECFIENLDKNSFRREICYARTFGQKQEIEMLRQMGLARGGSLENAVCVDGDVIMNPEGLRHPTEFVRHKILDAVGDLYQAGMPIIASYKGCCSGHFHTNALLKKVFEDESNYEIVDLNEFKKGTVAQKAVA